MKHACNNTQGQKSQGQHLFQNLYFLLSIHPSVHCLIGFSLDTFLRSPYSDIIFACSTKEFCTFKRYPILKGSRIFTRSMCKKSP